MFGGQAVPGIQFSQGINPYSVLDNRLIGRPEAFSGKEEDWPMWSLSVRSFAGSVHPEMLRLMQIAGARKDQEIEELEVGPSQKVLDNQLYFTLTQLCCKSKKVYDIISNIGVGRGFEIWRRLNWEFEPQIQQRYTGLCTRPSKISKCLAVMLMKA